MVVSQAFSYDEGYERDYNDDETEDSSNNDDDNNVGVVMGLATNGDVNHSGDEMNHHRRYRRHKMEGNILLVRDDSML
jgi:hypothetical protein